MRVQCKSDLNNDNEAATVTIGGNKVGSVFITSIVAGYDKAPAAVKRLTVAVNGTIEFAVSIPAANIGPQVIDIGGEWYTELTNTGTVTVTLPASGASGTIGDLNVFHRA